MQAAAAALTGTRWAKVRRMLLDPRTLTFLDRHYPSPGFSDEAITVYLAMGLHEAPGKPPPDPMEISQLEWRPLEEAMRMCREGEIEDGKTVIGLWLARDVLAT